MPDPATDVASSTAQQRTADFTRLSDDDKALIFVLSKQGHTQTAIAQLVGCHHTSVSRWLAKLEPTTEIAKARAHNRALEVTDAALEGAIKAARNGQPEHALEVADRLDTLPKRQLERNSVGVQVFVGMPNQGQLKPPAIEVTALSPPAFAQPSSDESL